MTLIFEFVPYIFQITGNLNGYQASITNLNIYNVRCVKIEPTARNTDFCLRIELCGKGKTLQLLLVGNEIFIIPIIHIELEFGSKLGVLVNIIMSSNS